MYTAGRGRGHRIFFKGPKFFHIPSHHTEFLDIPLLTKRKEKKEVPSLMSIKEASESFAANLMGIRI